jgi:hypothetical protein
VTLETAESFAHRVAEEITGELAVLLPRSAGGAITGGVCTAAIRARIRGAVQDRDRETAERLTAVYGHVDVAGVLVGTIRAELSAEPRKAGGA